MDNVYITRKDTQINWVFEIIREKYNRLLVRILARFFHFVYHHENLLEKINQAHDASLVVAEIDELLGMKRYEPEFQKIIFDSLILRLNHEKFFEILEKNRPIIRDYDLIKQDARSQYVKLNLDKILDTRKIDYSNFDKPIYALADFCANVLSIWGEPISIQAGRFAKRQIYKIVFDHTGVAVGNISIDVTPCHKIIYEKISETVICRKTVLQFMAEIVKN